MGRAIRFCRAYETNRQESEKKKTLKMKFFGFLISLLAGTTLAGKSDFDKCNKLPKGGSRRYTTPRTIERGNNQPEAINFLIDNRATLLEMFRRGNKENNVLNNLLMNNMHTLS